MTLMTDKKLIILQTIKDKLKNVLPKEGKALLFGSQARGDQRADSDWDILILLNKEKVTHDDFDEVAYPLIELGWGMGVTINPLLYTLQDWKKRHFSPFYHNVKQDCILLWH